MQASQKQTGSSRGKNPSPPSPFTFARATVPHQNHKEYNEDTVVADQCNGLAAVFDGVGGGKDRSGMVASRLGALVARRNWKQLVAQQTGYRADPCVLVHGDDIDITATTQGLIEKAQEAITAEGARRAPDYPGTTVALAIFCHAQQPGSYMMGYAHVGDSRIYLLRQRQLLTRLTMDDGYLLTLLEKQEITEADALRIDQATSADQLTETELTYFNKRNGITQALEHPHPKIRQLTIHVNQTTLAPGDRVLLCSDGIHDNLTDAEIEATLRRGARTTTARSLVQQAIKRSLEDKSTTIRPKFDDMSAVVITVHS